MILRQTGEWKKLNFNQRQEEIKEEKPKINFYDLDKFQPRKVTDLSKPTVPKKKYYKKKKKKPAIVNNAPVDKKPVGRPKKSE